MNTFKHTILPGLLAVVAALGGGACGNSDIDAYADKDKVWFTQKRADGTVVGDILRSFSHYPGSETLDVTFQVNLIGAVADRDRTYAVAVDQEQTTALSSEYEIHPTVLPAGAVSTDLTVTLRKSPRLETEEVKLTLKILPNETFDTGYSNSLSVSVTFNAITSKPDWWTDEIAKTYFGPYSKEKFEAFYAYSGRNEIEGLQPSELRRLLLGFKAYIREHGLTEADGSPITIPVY